MYFPPLRFFFWHCSRHYKSSTHYSSSPGLSAYLTCGDFLGVHVSADLLGNFEERCHGNELWCPPPRLYEYCWIEQTSKKQSTSLNDVAMTTTYILRFKGWCKHDRRHCRHCRGKNKPCTQHTLTVSRPHLSGQIHTPRI